MKELKGIRHSLGLSQQKLANLLGTTRTTISMVEIGTRTLPFHSLKKLAEMERISGDELHYTPTYDESYMIRHANDQMVSRLEKRITELDSEIEVNQTELESLTSAHAQAFYQLKWIGKEMTVAEGIAQERLDYDRTGFFLKWLATRTDVQRIINIRTQLLQDERTALVAMLNELNPIHS